MGGIRSGGSPREDGCTVMGRKDLIQKRGQKSHLVGQGRTLLSTGPEQEKLSKKGRTNEAMLWGPRSLEAAGILEGRGHPPASTRH